MLSSQTRADYFDVTLVGDDSKYNLAHKVVLATSSAKRVHPHPLVNFDIATFRFRNFSMFFYGIGIGFEKNWYRKKYRYRFRKFLVSEKVSVLVSKKFGIEKSIGIGIGKILVSKKVSVLVSKKIGIGKKYRYRYRSDFGFRHTLNRKSG